MKTKWGNARVDKGYYRITSRKEGNCGKLLHRLIARDYFGDWIDEPLIDGEKIEIHHIDGNPLNNCVLNLLPLPASEHRRLHHKGKFVSEETRKKMSKNNCRYWEGKNLPNEIKIKIAEGHKGKTYSEETKKKISESKKGENHPMYGKHHSEETRKKMSIVRNTSGYMNVHKSKTKNATQGFVWVYTFYEDGKQKKIQSVDLDKLEAKVKSKGLKWEVF